MADSGVVARWRTKLAERLKARTAAKAAYEKAKRQVMAARRVIARHSSREPWHPRATRVLGESAGSFTTGRPKIVWHTTEGASAEGAIQAYRATRSWPHFTLDARRGLLFQHVAIDQASRALAHPSGPETNRARAIQVELVGHASETHKWGDADYRQIAQLARWIEANAGVPRACSVKFTATAARRMSGTEFVGYTGHCGHQHVPGNDHWDPGAFHIEKVI